jgi:hypothetical protein
MKTCLVRFALAATTATLAACGTMNPHKNEIPLDKPSGPNRYLQDDSTPQQPGSANPDSATQPPATNDAPPTPPPPKTDSSAGASGNTVTTPPTPPPPTSQYPYGKPVPGKKGFVNSPYDDKAGMIDVRDYAPGTKVRDPYTNKIFLVP